jgi:4-hydroxyphenylacetate 3-monooxygenase
MIRTGAQCREGLRNGREVWIDRERAKDIRLQPAVFPIVDIRARIYDMQHEPAHSSVLTYFADNDRHSAFNRLPMEDWHDKRNAVDAVLQDIKGVVDRVGDDTIGEMWSLYDGRDAPSEIDPRFAANIDRLNSDCAGHRLTFLRFAQAPHFNHLAVYGAFDFSGPLDFARTAAGLSDKVKRSP